MINNIIGHPKKQKSGIDSNLSSDDLNHFFRTVAVSDDHKPADNYEASQFSGDRELFTFERIDSSQITSMLTKLNIWKSTGPDDLSAHFLQKTADCIAIPLTTIYNKSLNTGTVPSAWKQCNVTPVHKGGDTENPGNYRP